MTRSVLIYAFLVVVLTVLGIIASVILFGNETPEALRPPPAAVNREPAPAAATPETTPTPSPEPAIKEENSGSSAVRVLGVLGTARKFQREEDAWSTLVPGEDLESDETVRTGTNSKLTLGVGAESKLELAEQAELTIGEVSTNDRRFKLLRGRISVEYREEDRRIRIENEDGSAVAEAEEGIFTVLNTGQTVAVATKTGSVNLFAGGSRVAVGAGKQSSTTRGAVPLAPTPIPVDILLRMIDPGCQVQRESFIVLKGVTSPGAIVTANGNLATIRKDGHFAVRVPLRHGKNRIQVVSQDATGSRKEKTFPCVTVDPGAPIKNIDIKWGPKGKQGES